LVKKIRGTTVSGTTPNTLLGNYKKYTLIYIVFFGLWYYTYTL
jgi:hypothetical protein